MSETISSQPTVVRTDRGLSIAGTRITLYHIMDYIKAGRSPEEIRDSFNLTESCSITIWKGRRTGCGAPCLPADGCN